jgi:hypothetical protein
MSLLRAIRNTDFGTKIPDLLVTSDRGFSADHSRSLGV